MKNYLTYPCEVMNITQGYTGNYSHGPHTTGKPKDYPWDEACGGSGRSPMYCPCDRMVVKKLYTKGTNTIWLESTEKVNLADGSYEYVTLMITHPNNDDMARLWKGKTFKRGEIICYEGTDGNATGNHFHFAVGKGKLLGTGWVKNTKGKWVLTCTGGSKKPETMFYIDRTFTTLVKKTQGIKFKNVPKQTSEDDFLPARGYFKKGDTHENIGKVAQFLYRTFPAYTSVKALGDYFGNNLYKSIKEFQRRTGLETDGNIGPLTLAKLEEYGFKY
jgi:hypothetical protein